MESCIWNKTQHKAEDATMHKRYPLASSTCQSQYVNQSYKDKKKVIKQYTLWLLYDFNYKYLWWNETSAFRLHQGTQDINQYAEYGHESWRF